MKFLVSIHNNLKGILILIYHNEKTMNVCLSENEKCKCKNWLNHWNGLLFYQFFNYRIISLFDSDQVDSVFIIAHINSGGAVVFKDQRT